VLITIFGKRYDYIWSEKRAGIGENGLRHDGGGGDYLPNNMAGRRAQGFRGQAKRGAHIHGTGTRNTNTFKLALAPGSPARPVVVAVSLIGRFKLRLPWVRAERGAWTTSRVVRSRGESTGGDSVYSISAPGKCNRNDSKAVATGSSELGGRSPCGCGITKTMVRQPTVNAI